jgi:hypothetical protein
MSRQGTERQESAGPPETRERESAGADGESHVTRYRERVQWPDPVVAGVGTWLAGVVLTAVPLWAFGLAEDLAIDRLELAVLVLVEGVGGTVNQGELAATLSAYGGLDTNLFGAGPAVSMLVPAAVLVTGGYGLADRHIETGATTRPLDGVLAGGSLAPWFTVVLVLSALVTRATVEGTVSVDVSTLAVVGLLYAGVFASAGGAIRARAQFTSSRALLAGIGAVVTGTLLWLVAERPLAGRSAGDRAELGEPSESLRLLRSFVAEHGVQEGEILPAWFVVLALFGAGATLAYAAGRRDPALGAGEGARLGVPYGLLVCLVVVGHVVAVAVESYRESGWTAGEIQQVTELSAATPRIVLLAGVVYPVAFAAVGGAVGALLYGATRHR